MTRISAGSPPNTSWIWTPHSCCIMGSASPMSSMRSTTTIPTRGADGVSAGGDQSYVIRGVGLIHNLGEIGSIVVTQAGGTPVLVRDLGRTTLSHQEREGILGKDLNPDAIEGIVLMLKYQNPSQTLRGLHAKVAELNAKLAADGVRIAPYIDRDDLVHATIHKVGPDHSRGDHAGFYDPDHFSRQPSQRHCRGGEHTARSRVRVLAAQSHACVGQSAVAWRHRFRHSRRRSNRRDRSGAAAARSDAE